MIRYRLRCGQGHSFDAWFDNSAAYDRLEQAGHLSCAECDDTQIRKAPMAPAVPRKGRSTVREQAPADRQATEPPASAPATDAPVPAAKAPADQPSPEKLLRAMAAVRAWVEKTHENVGKRFVEEARAIQDGDAEDRPIRGEATLADAQDLLDEGIDVLPLPMLPSRDEMN